MRDDDCRWVKQSLVHDGRIVRRVIAAALDGDIYVQGIVKNNSNDTEEGKSRCSTIFTRIKASDSNSNRSSIIFLFEPLEIQHCPREGILYRTHPCTRDFLFEVCGVLYAVYIVRRHSYEIIKIYVWRMDLSQMKWIQVESLGNRAFLLGDSGCTWCWADASSCSGIEGNCIYMTSRWSRTMHQYRLEDDSYIFFKACPCNILLDYPIWFMPRNRTRLSPDMLIAEISEDTEDTNHVEELDEMKMERPTTLLSLFCQLPQDMLISVAQHLHLFDYMNLRTTCKILHSNIPRPQWRSNNCSYPLFMSLKNKKGGICELWDPFQNICHTIVTHYSTNLISTIEFCKDGWLFLRIDGDSLQCYNPFIGKSYRYPSDSDEIVNHLSSLAFSTCPTSADCLTVGLTWAGVFYFLAGTDHWEYAYIEFDSEKFESNRNSRPKYHDDAFYILGNSGNLGVLKMVDGEWIWKVHKGPIPEEEAEDILLNSGHLVEIDGQLISVFIEGFGRRLHVFKFDTLGSDWVALDNLGDYMLFLSPASSFSVSTKDINMRNRIYLSKRIGNEMVFYSLNTGMYHTSSGQHPSKDFYGMRSQSFCCWI